jgi:hypothetical protein
VTALDAKYEYEYLVKYKNMSYLHIQWLSGAEIGEFGFVLRHTTALTFTL